MSNSIQWPYGGRQIREHRDTTVIGTNGYKRLRSDFNMTFDSGDPFGSAMAWMFAIAHVLWHESAEEIPNAWDYRHSPICDRLEMSLVAGETDNEDDAVEEYEEFETGLIMDAYREGVVSDNDLLAFGEVIHRYIQILDSAGRSY